MKARISKIRNKIKNGIKKLRVEHFEKGFDFSFKEKDVNVKVEVRFVK